MEQSRILCLRFPNWPVQAWRLRISRDSRTAEIPSAIALHTPPPDTPASETAAANPDTRSDLTLLRQLFPAARSGPAVVAVSAAAWKQGVRPGLPLAEARSLARPPQARQTPKSAAAATAAQPATQPGAGGTAARSKSSPAGTAEPVLFIPWNPADDRAELRQLSDPVRRFAPVVGLDSMPLPDCLLLNVTGCGPLFGGEEQLVRELLLMLQQAGLSARAAIAENISAAWALAHTDEPGRPAVTITPAAGCRPLLNQLPAAAARLSPTDLEILQHLGIRRIGQLLALPVQDLPARLSAECVLRVRQLRGDIAEQIIPLPETRPIQANWVGDEPAVGIRDLQWILARLCEDISTQLEQRRLACSGLHCEFIAADKRTLQMPAGLVRPERQSQLLADVLTLRLEFLVLQALRMEHRTRGSSSSRTQSATPPETTDRSSPTDHNTEAAPLPALDFAALAELPIAAVRLTAVSGPIPVSRQKRLFADAEEQSEDVAEHLGTLLSRLAGRLGTEAVLTAVERDDPRPEYSIGLLTVTGSGFEKLLDQLTGTAGERPDRQRRTKGPEPEVTTVAGSGGVGPARPLRLLSEPMEVELKWVQAAESAGNAAERPGSEAILNCWGREWRLREWTGPERIQTAWWTDAACHRDYYQAVTSHGSRFWLFRNLTTGRWYLHGIYD
ncbi:MAG: hypothetical protein RLZZ436_1831 [Planctomycetota bacterium]